MNDKIEIGRIVSTHGIKGEVKVEPWCDSPDMLLKIKKIYTENEEILKIVTLRIHKNSVLMQLEGINDITAAEKLKNTVILTDKKEVILKKDYFFIKDLIGINVFDADTGVKYGSLTDILKTGSNDVYVIMGDEKEYLVPAIKECIIETDMDKGIMKIRPLKGLFD